MAPAKAHPYLVSFGKLGLIEQDAASGRYGLGPLALQLGLISLQQFDPVRLATPRIVELAQLIGHTVGDRGVGQPRSDDRAHRRSPIAGAREHAPRHRREPARHRVGPAVRCLPAARQGARRARRASARWNSATSRDAPTRRALTDQRLQARARRDARARVELARSTPRCRRQRDGGAGVRRVGCTIVLSLTAIGSDRHLRYTAGRRDRHGTATRRWRELSRQLGRRPEYRLAGPLRKRPPGRAQASARSPPSLRQRLDELAAPAVRTLRAARRRSGARRRRARRASMPAMRSAIACDIAGGAPTSCAPAITSVGSLMRAKSIEPVDADAAWQHGDIALRVAAQQRALNAADVAGSPRAKPRVEVALHHRLDDARPCRSTPPSRCAAPTSAAPRRDTATWCSRAPAAHQLGVAHRQPLPDHAAHRQADRTRPARGPIRGSARAASSTRSSIVYGPGGTAEPPWPRWS